MKHLATPLGSAAVAFIMAAILLAPRPGQACLAGPTHHELDPDEQEFDHTPPGAVTVLSAQITQRGLPPKSEGGCSYASDSTDDLGIMQIKLVPPDDDRTPPEKIGYRIEALDDDVPFGLLPNYDIRADENGVIILGWADGANDNQEPLDFRLRIRAVDLGGNVGPATNQIWLLDPGTGGCSHIGPVHWIMGPLAFLLLWTLLRRRRRVRIC